MTKNRDFYIYPAVFEKSSQGHYGVFFPDLPGCVSMGDDLQHAHIMAKEALGLHLWGFERDNEEIPAPSTIDAIQSEYPGEIIGLIEVSLPAFRAKLDTRAVKKTLTIPYYLNQMAEKKKINFSHELQAALKNRLGIHE